MRMLDFGPKMLGPNKKCWVLMLWFFDYFRRRRKKMLGRNVGGFSFSAAGERF